MTAKKYKLMELSIHRDVMEDDVDVKSVLSSIITATFSPQPVDLPLTFFEHSPELAEKINRLKAVRDIQVGFRVLPHDLGDDIILEVLLCKPGTVARVYATLRYRSIVPELLLDGVLLLTTVSLNEAINQYGLHIRIVGETVSKAVELVKTDDVNKLYRAVLNATSKLERFSDVVTWTHHRYFDSDSLHVGYTIIEKDTLRLLARRDHVFPLVPD